MAAADAGFLREVFASTLAPELQPLVDLQLSAQQRDYRAAYPHARHELVVVDGRPAGQLRVDRSPHAIHLVDISLLPSARGRGIGTRVITALLDEARAAGLPVTLNVFAHSPARRLYQRLGFVEISGAGAQLAMRWPT